jgi:hypothetical protein
MTAPAPLDRLVRKEVALGQIRDMQPPDDHIGLTQIAPFLDVQTDDVIFEYIKGGLSEGLAPARAEDAESELSMKDQGAYVQGRASVIDWAQKDRYAASDVTRYRDALLLQESLNGTISTAMPTNFVGRTVDDFNARVARDDAARRRRLDNRLEWLIMTGLQEGIIEYDDGKIAFTVDYKRPSNQNKQAPHSAVPWNDEDADPIGDLTYINEFMNDTYHVALRTVWTSQKVVNNLWKASRFRQVAVGAIGLPVGGASATLDVNYLMAGYGPEAALATIKAATGIEFKTYDSVYKTRPFGSSTWTFNRYTDENLLIMLPDEGMLRQIDDTDIGFAKTLTSPHPEGNWTSGFYEWEMDERDPWQTVRGTGIKAFPIFPFMEYSYTMQAL